MNKHRGLLGVVLLFLGVRFLYPIMFVPAQSLFDSEDIVRGTIAHDLLHGGLKVPFWDYLADHYSGGSIVVGLVAVPFFLLFGSTLFALRLVALLFSLGIVLVWYTLVARNFDGRAALFTALSFAVPPMAYLEASSQTMGFHTESMLFSALAFLLLFEMLRRDDGRLRWPAGLGLTLGFGSWFCYTAMVSVAIVLVWWFWHDRRFMVGKPFAVFLAFFGLGFSPWIPANVSHHFRGLQFLGEGLRYENVRDLGETAWRIVKVTLWYLPTVFVLRPFRDADSLGWPAISMTLFGGALLYLVLRDARRASPFAPPPAGWFFASASVVYVLAVSATRYNIAPFGSLYLAPMLPLFFAALGVALSDLERTHRWSRAAVAAVFGVTLLGGGLGLWHRLDFRWPGASFTMPGYSYGQLANAIDLRHPYDYAYFASLLPRVERTMTPAERSEFLGHLWSPNGYNVKREAIAAEAARFARFGEPARSIGYLQLGIVLRAPFMRADEPLVARLADENSWVSEGLRLGRLGRYFLRLDGVPVVDRLPLALGPDTRVIFLDPATHHSPDEVGWVGGEQEATFLIESSGVVSSVAVRLTNGDRPNAATLTSPQNVKSIPLMAGESVVETLDVGPGVLLEGKRYWKISVASRYGHFPILTRREADTRYLGVHVTVRLAEGGRTF